MWKMIAVIGSVLSFGVLGALWCALKVASDDDDFWGISDEGMEDGRYE